MTETARNEPRAQDGLAAWINPARTALLAVDMQVDFASSQGRLGRSGVDLSTIAPALANAQRLADGARAAGAPVIFVRLDTRPDQDSPAWRERIRRRGGSPDHDLALGRAGEPGSAFHGPQPAPGELIVSKTRYSGFVGTTLDATLRARGVDTVVVCGLTTECCVDCTVRDAFHRDFHVFVAADACASYDPGLHAATLKALDLHCAILADTDQVLEAWGT